MARIPPRPGYNPAWTGGTPGPITSSHSPAWGSYPAGAGLEPGLSGDNPRDRGNPGQDTLGSIWRLPVRQRQMILRRLGFNVKVDGKPGPQTAAAAWAYTQGHNSKWFNNKGRDWQLGVWNKHFAQDNTGIGQVAATQNPSGPGKPGNKNNTVAPQPSDAQFSSGVDSAALSILGDSDSLVGDVNTGSFINVKEGRVGKLIDRIEMGRTAKEQGFGSALRGLGRDVERLPVVAGQNLRDIKNWYGDVDTALDKSTASSALAADTAVTGVENYGKSVAQALGGEANMGAADVGAVGAAESANLRALKLIGSQTAGEMGAAIGAEGLSARTRQRNLDAAALEQAKAQLRDTEIQAGAAENAGMLQADQYNNQLSQQQFQNVQGIREHNTGVDQQRFQNAVAAAQARIAALAAVPELAIKGAEAAYALNNPAGAFGSGDKPKGPKGTWAGTDARVKGQVADLTNQTIMNLANQGADVNSIVRAVNSIYKSRGWSLRNKNVVNAIRANLEGAGVKTSPKWWGGYGYRG